MPNLRERWRAAHAAWSSGTTPLPVRSGRPTAMRRSTRPTKPRSTRGEWHQSVTAIAGIVSVLLVAAGLFYTNQANRRTQELTARGQAADRFTRAIDQLGQEDTRGDNRLSIRLGAIYSLEVLGRDSPSDAGVVRRVLCAFVRRHAPLDRVSFKPTQEPSSTAKVPKFRVRAPSSGEDVRAAVSAIVVDYQIGFPEPGCFAGSLLGLPGLNLEGARLQSAILVGADISGSNLFQTDLSHTKLIWADLQAAEATWAKFDEAELFFADLRDAAFRNGSFRGTDLRAANLGGADLSNADLYKARLAGADLSGADLSGTFLYGADLSLDPPMIVGWAACRG